MSVQNKNTRLYKREHIAILVSCFTHKHVSIEAGMILGAPTSWEEASYT